MQTLCAGILSLSPSFMTVNNSIFTFQKSGAILVQISPSSTINLTDNQIYQCEGSGIYISGEEGNATIHQNTIKFCTSPAI